MTGPGDLGDPDLEGLVEQLRGLDVGMADLAEVLITPLREVILGHRAALLEAGVTPELADEMAADAHRYLTARLLGFGDDEDPDPKGSA